MGFPKQRYTGYEDLPGSQITNQQMIEDEEALRLVGNAVAVFSHSKRLVASSLGFGPDVGATEDLTFELTPENPATIIRLPMSQVVSGMSGKIRVTILAARDDDTAGVELEVNAGRDSARGYFSAATGVYHLITAVVDVGRNKNPALYSDEELTISLHVSWAYGEGNTVAVAVRSLAAYELGDTTMPRSVRDWVDTTGANNKIGQPDYPLSPGMQRILNGNAHECAAHRMTRASIFHRCFRLGNKVPNAGYDGDEAGLGEWIIRKPRGATVVEATGYVAPIPAGAIDAKFSLYSIQSLNYNNEVAPFTAGDLLTGQTTGVQARILKVVDAGATGTIYLGFLNGANLFQAGEVIKDEGTGEADVNGAMTGPLSIASDENNFAVGSYEAFLIAGQIEEEGEYWARFDVKKVGAVNTVYLPWFMIVDGLAANVAHKLPLPSNVEQDDDVRASTWLNTKTTLEKVWARCRSIMMSDFWYSSGGQAEGRASSYTSLAQLEYNIQHGVFGLGVVYPSPGASRLYARVWLRRTDTRLVRKVDVVGHVGPVAVDDVVTGAISGATGLYERFDAAGGYIVVSSLSGEYQVGEVVNFTSGGSATVASVPYTFDAVLKIKLMTSIVDPPLEFVEHEIDISNLPQNQTQKIEMVIPISTEYVNDYSVQTDMPYMWVIMAKTDELGDHLLLDKYQVFEEPLIPGGLNATLED